MGCCQIFYTIGGRHRLIQVILDLLLQTTACLDQIQLGLHIPESLKEVGEHRFIVMIVLVIEFEVELFTWIPSKAGPNLCR